MRKRLVITVVSVCYAGTLAPVCFGQTPDGALQGQAVQTGTQAPVTADKDKLPRFGVALSVGTLGAGIEVATAVARHTNIRGGFNYFKYSLSGTDSNNGLGYNGTLRLASGEVLVDQNLAGPFHVSGGALVYNGFQGTGTVQVPGGQSFTLNNVSYVSSPADPVTGTGAITVRKISPELLIGFGNLLPRNRRHFAVNLDIGAAFQGSPNVLLNLNGSTCLAGACTAIGSNQSVQSNITAEQGKISNNLKPFQFYPIVRLSFGYKE